MTKESSYSLSKQQIVLAELRRHRMLELRVAGYTEREIADELEVSQTLVHQGIKKELGSHEAELREEITQKVRQDVLRERPAAEPEPETKQDVRKIIESKKIPAPAPKELKQKPTKKITVNRRW